MHTSEFAVAETARLLVGADVQSFERHENSWSLGLEQYWLVLECLWRLLEGGQVVVTNCDDRHMFGLTEQLDAQAEVRQRLVGRRIQYCTINHLTGDLTLQFQGGWEFQAFANSTGYESWNLSSTSGDHLLTGTAAMPLAGKD
jgi:hypothetical protein